jgi:Leucine-rich repeat (LRR) protein
MEQAELEEIIEKARCSKLSRLDLRCKQLTSLPKSINNITSLYYLDLSYNELTSLPENIGGLTSLNCLDLLDNELTSLPKSIGKLKNLKSLVLTGNPLVDLSSLKELCYSPTVYFIDISLPRRYWIKFSDWKQKRIILK